MSGWDRIEGHWWPSIADALPRPWPREAVLMDLRLAGRAARVEQVKGNRAKGKQPRASRPSDDIP